MASLFTRNRSCNWPPQAGFSLGQADILRRAMSKKKRAVMEKMRQQFIAGALANDYSQEVAVATFDYIDQFANYGFNHSARRGLYQVCV